MSQEIVYTSAPRGLKAGSRGYCTVLSTPGMAKTLSEQLESLSGYVHVYAPHTPEARLNPVNYMHLWLKTGGIRYHLLSRVADAGLDYTGRSNKLAHHIVLDTNELVAAGPAWAMSQPGFMETSFRGEPGIKPEGRKPPPGDAPTKTCRAWQSITGDAGWGGVLAETAWRNPGQPAVIIFRPGMDLLPLLAESLALLPPEQRWNVTFSTYFTKLPPGLDCQWRCVLEGTADAKAALRLPQALVINLATQLGAPPDGELVACARSGKPPRTVKLQSATAASAAAPVVQVGALSRSDPFAKAIKAASTQRTRAAAGAVPAEADAIIDDLPVVVPYRTGHNSKSRSRYWLTIAVGLLFLVSTSAAFVAGFLVGRGRTQLASKESSDIVRAPATGIEQQSPARSANATNGEKSATADSQLPARVEVAPPAAIATDVKTPLSDAKQVAEVSTRPVTTAPPSTEKTPSLPSAVDTTASKGPSSDALANVTTVSTASVGTGAGELETSRPDVFADIRRRNYILALPALATSNVQNSKPETLAKLSVLDPKECKLTLIGLEQAFSEMSQPPILKEKENGWELMFPISSIGRTSWTPFFARFWLDEGVLKFEWNSTSLHTGVKIPDRLQNCLLKIQVGSDICPPCALRKPSLAEPPHWNFGDSPGFINLSGGPQLSERNERRLQFALDASLRDQLGHACQIETNQIAFPILARQESGASPSQELGPPLTIQVTPTYKPEDQQVQLEVSVFVMPVPSNFEAAPKSRKRIQLSMDSTKQWPANELDQFLKSNALYANRLPSIKSRRIPDESFKTRDVIRNNTIKRIAELETKLPKLATKISDLQAAMDAGHTTDKDGKSLFTLKENAESDQKQAQSQLEKAKTDLKTVEGEIHSLNYLRRLYELMADLQNSNTPIKFDVSFPVDEKIEGGGTQSHKLVLFRTGRPTDPQPQ